ncbi:MAG: NAD-dependent epimerase/dehydratase family protein [bacterium]|nr:NAD-dependent epimerase/dehydratase family protein [Planctomycetota bacterium]HIL52472.1 NAD-dependent epimerase/dehydratase family protein [Planctomycetota bacterium]
MKVLVSGASGFLGAHIVQLLCRQGHEVCALVRSTTERKHLAPFKVEYIQGDLRDEHSLNAACRGIEGLVHCAAKTGYRSRQNEEQRAVNVEGTTALLRAAHLTRIQRIVHVSSVAAVGATREETLLDESALWNLGQLEVNYARTKRQAEERAMAAARGGMPLVVVNPSALLGPRMDGRGPSGLITGVAQGNLPWVPPGGFSVTDVRDVAAAVVAALEKGRVAERYILAGHNLSWRKLYEAIALAAGGRVPQADLSLSKLRWLTRKATLLDRLHLCRTPMAPEIYRSYGWYSWFNSNKAAEELDYRVRPLPEILADSVGG